MDDARDDVTKLPFKCLKFAGQELYGSHKIATILFILVMLIGLILSIMELFFHNEGPITWAGTFQTATVAFQLLAKLSAYKFNNKNLKELVKDMEQFWPLNIAGDETERGIRNINYFVAWGLKSFIIADVFTTFIMMFSALLVSGHKLPVTLYHIIDFNRNDYYTIVFVWFLMFGYFVTCFATGFDGLFISLITSASSQVRMMKQVLMNMTVERANMAFIKENVQHHIFIIRFVNKIQDMFSYVFIIQFFISCTAVCMGIYLIATSGVTDAAAFTPAFLYLVANLIELFLYCITGSYVRTQLETLDEAVYFSDWWMTGGSHLRHAALMIIQKAQNTKPLQAVGVVDLDVQTYVSILRLSFSFYVLMNSIGIEN